MSVKTEEQLVCIISGDELRKLKEQGSHQLIKRLSVHCTTDEYGLPLDWVNTMSLLIDKLIDQIVARDIAAQTISKELDDILNLSKKTFLKKGKA